VLNVVHPKIGDTCHLAQLELGRDGVKRLSEVPTRREEGQMTFKNLLVYVALISFICLAVIACGAGRQTQVPDYQIVQREDVSLAGVVRLQFRVRVDSPLTEAQLRQICNDIIETQKVGSYNAISFLFYLPGTDTQGFYTAGKAIWAPDGKWENASQVSTGDYSRHRLAVEVGSALGDTPTPSDTDLSEETRRQIFYDLVVAQDSGVEDEEAYEIIAQKYDVSIEVVRKIAIEGVMQGWPMP